MIAPGEDVVAQLREVLAHRGDAAGHTDVAGEHRADRQLDAVRHADVADRRAGPGDGDGGVHRLAGADALQHGVGADAAGELADRGLTLLAALGDDVGGAELLGDLLARRVPRHGDHPLGAHPGRGEHAGQADRAVADDDHGVALLHAGGDGGVPAGAHDVGEREQRGHERRRPGTSGVATRVPSASGHAGVLALAAVDRAAVAVLGAPEAAVRAGGLDAGRGSAGRCCRST